MSRPPMLGWGGSGECRAKPIKAEGELLGPGPGAIETEMHDPSATREPGGHVQDAVAERGDLAAGDGRVVGEADELRLCDEIGGSEHALEPGVVLGCLLAREVAEPGGLGLADPVLDAGVAALSKLEECDRSIVALARRARGGDEGGMAQPSLDVEQRELGAGMGTTSTVPPSDRYRRTISISAADCANPATVIVAARITAWGTTPPNASQ